MADFSLKALPNVILGSHVLSRLGQIIPRWTGDVEKRFMLVCDPSLRDYGIEEKALQSFKENEVEVILFDEISIASSSEVEDALSLARGARPRAIVSLGGIKAAAIGRATAALYSEEGDIYDYIEGRLPASEPLPFVEVPTTCRDPAMFMNKTPVADARNKQISFVKIQEDLCKGVIIDPNVFVHIPQNTQRAMILQATVLAFEGFISTKGNFFTDAMLAKALEMLLLALDVEDNVVLGSPKEELAAQGGFLASLGATVSAPGAATALATACNARYRTPSSVVSAILFPHVVEDAFRSRAEKTLALAKMLKSAPASASEEGEDDGSLAARKLRSILDNLGLPVRLKDAGLTMEQLAAAVEDACKMEFMSHTPRAMTSDDLFDLVKRAY